MAVRMHSHCNEHFTNADHPCGWMGMFYLAGTQIFRVLLKEPDYTRPRSFKLLSSLRQSGKPTDGPGSFRRFHFMSAVWNHLQERMFAIRRIACPGNALSTDQFELDRLSRRQVLNRIQHGPAVGSGL